MSKLKVIVTGATGMVGEGVLHECLQHADVERVLVVGRRSCQVQHPKLKEIVHETMEDWNAFASELEGYDACFYCLGVSSVGMTEADYTRITYDYTIRAAEVLVERSPDLVFCYVTGASTDSTEQGRVMWARVKGRTENMLLRLFKRAYMFRPGYLHPTPGLQRTHRFYRYLSWMYPLLRGVIPNHVGTLRELGLAMIRVVQDGYDRPILEVKDIRHLAN